MTSPPLEEPTYPPGWARCTIGQAGEVMLGQTKTQAQSPGELLPYLRAANVQDNMLDLTDLAEMPIRDPDRYTLKPWDILLCEGLGSRDLLGRAAAYRGDLGRLCFQNHLLRFRARSGVDPAFALLVFRAYQKMGIFASVAKGIGIVNISLARFRQLPFPLPPLSVQHELADSARSIQNTIDLIVDSVNTSLEELEHLAANARDDEILGTDSGSWHGRTVGSSPWPLIPAAEVIAGGSSIAYGMVQPGPDVQEGVRYVRGLDLQDGQILIDQLWRTAPEIAERYERTKLEPGDVLVNIIRHTKVAVVPDELAGANITRTTALLRPGNKVISAYLAHWLASRAAQNWMQANMRGIDMPGLNLRELRQLPVPVPPMSAQRVIVDHLDGIVSKVNDLYRSFSSLRTALPLLEGHLLASFAYGSAARSISDQVSDALQRQLSGDLLEALIAEDKAFSTRASSGSNLPIGQGRKSGDMSDSAGMTVNTIQVLEALEALNDSASPERLYASLKLKEAAIDSFYSALRELVRSDQIKVVKLDSLEVLVQAVRQA